MPLRTVRDDVIVSRRGELTIGWELTLPVAYSLSEEEYDAMILRYCEAVKRLPDWTLVHRQDVYLKRRWEAPPGERWRKSFLQDCSDGIWTQNSHKNAKLVKTCEKTGGNNVFLPRFF